MEFQTGGDCRAFGRAAVGESTGIFTTPLGSPCVLGVGAWPKALDDAITAITTAKPFDRLNLPPPL
jgi:hypothetical protein